MGPDLEAQEQFGPYLVYERLGVGGMATVHRALERGIDGSERMVALKRLLPHLAADASFIKSFVREAKLASLLDHVNIVQIFECGRVGAQYFISMEYIDGRDIRRILRHARSVAGPPPIDVTIGLLLQLCDALDYAHHKCDEHGHPLGLVHRDVSPSNLLVTTTGQVKIIDFGIAKAQSAPLRTQTGRVKGKLAYMAPEALNGRELDARSDLFAAGVIGHELLTARPLFATKNDYETLMKIHRGDIMPPSTFNQSCPPELDGIILRALARDPDERFLTAGELREELIAMRRQYHLQANEHTVAGWLHWAFSLDAQTQPAAATRDSKTEIDVRSVRHGAAPPQQRDDDEAVEIAWGGGDDHNGEPIVLDDVPDVSEKHLASASALGAEVRLDLDDLADDIPTPLPSHGARAESGRTPAASTPARPTVRARPAAPLRAGSPAREQRDPAPPASTAVGTGDAIPTPNPPAAPRRAGSPTREPRDPAPPASTAVGTGDAIPTPNLATGASASVRAVMIPPRPRAVTGPPRMIPAGSTTTRTEPSLPPVVPGIETLTTMVREPAAPRSVPAGSIPPPRAASPEPTTRRGIGSLPPPTRERSSRTVVPRAETATVESAPQFAAGEATISDASPHDTLAEQASVFSEATISDASPHDALAIERAARFAVDELGMAADTVLTIPAQRAEPVVRFREPTRPPPPATGRAPTNLDEPTTTPNSQPLRLVTPATELFADPDPEPTPAPITATATAAVPPAAPRAAPRRINMLRALVFCILLALIGAGAMLGTLYLSQDRDAPTEVAQPVAQPRSKTTATLQLAVIPPDAEIVLEGQPPHTGSPWQLELAAGTYQIEIHREGHKGWLTAIELVPGEIQTVRVVLEPVDPVVVADATLIVHAPPAFEVVLDGTIVAPSSPFRTAISLGAHTVTLRMNGTEVWRRELNARASAIYEFTPTITEPAPATHPGEAPAGPPPPNASGAANPPDASTSPDASPPPDASDPPDAPGASL